MTSAYVGMRLLANLQNNTPTSPASSSPAIHHGTFGTFSRSSVSLHGVVVELLDLEVSPDSVAGDGEDGDSGESRTHGQRYRLVDPTATHWHSRTVYRCEWWRSGCQGRIHRRRWEPYA